MSGFFYRLGKLAGPSIRKGKWIWKSLTGSEQELLEAEKQVGADLDKAFRENMELLGNPQLEEEVSEIVSHLASKLKKKKRKFTPRIVRSDSVNAFALPGGYIYLTTGLIELLKGPGGRFKEELSFVLAHEIGHIVHQDPMQRAVTDTAVEAAFKLLMKRGPTAWLGSLGAKALQSAYSQDRELLADEFAVRLMRASGYPPEASLSLLQRLYSQSKEKAGALEFLKPYFSSHPPLPVRMKQIKKFISA